MRRLFTIILSIFVVTQSFAASPKGEEAREKMTLLRATIAQAQRSKINTLKEETTLRTAEIFMDYVAWDEANFKAVKDGFLACGAFKNEADNYAKMLPEFERSEIVKMLDSSIDELKKVISGEAKRLDTPRVDWSRVSLKGDCIEFDGRPVFLADWTWKPRSKRFTEYHGDQSISMLSPTSVTQSGDVAPNALSQLKSDLGKTAGFIFMNHSAMPAWAKAQDPTLMEGAGIKYVQYDINNPLARDIYSKLLKNTVPYLSGKKATELGYMLCNEPHWNCIEGSYASGAISERAGEDFKVWLEAKHKSIKVLNRRWGVSFRDFESVEFGRMVKAEDRGSAPFFDFISYNMDRVSDWFTFLRTELHKYDPKAKSHIKLMPNYWTTNSIDHGLDFEYLCRNSDILGNDASSCGKYLYGKTDLPWVDDYEFDWIETCMGYDFMKSVSPDKIIFNTEGHHLSTSRSRNLYQTPEYVRCNYWLSTIHGQSAIQTWFWARDEKGAYCRSGKISSGYAASNNHQPRVVNEVHTTIADINSISDVMMAIQRERKAMRIFYTKASAINKRDHMIDIYHLYERLNFEGMPVGFATAGIIENNENNAWDVISIYKSPMVYESDIKALQSYIDQGGVVVVDEKSLLTNEYGEPLKQKLTPTKGKIINVASLDEVATESLAIASSNGRAPDVVVKESNDRGKRGVLWRVVALKSDKSYVVNLLNLGNSEAEIELRTPSGAEVRRVTNLLDGTTRKEQVIRMNPNDVLVLSVDI